MKTRLREPELFKKMRVVSLLAFALSAHGCSNRGTVAVGGSCVRDESCVAGVCFLEKMTSTGISWTDGYCSGFCGTDGRCPGGTCTALDDGHFYCLGSCESDRDCRKDYVCSSLGRVCVPDCRLGWSCGSTLTCDATRGDCVVPQTSATQPVGASCVLNAECISGLCIPSQLTDAGAAWTGGACSQTCATSSDCPDGAACVHFEDGSGYCAATCSEPAGCRPGYVCSLAVAACLPDCGLGWWCGTQLVCDAKTGACVAPTVEDAGAPDGATDATDSTDAPSDTGGWRGGDAGGRGPGPGGVFAP